MTVSDLFHSSKPRDRDFESCQLISFDKSNSLRKVHFLLKNGCQVKESFVLKVGYLVIIVRKPCLQMSTTIIFENCKIICDWFIYLKYSSNWWFNVTLLIFKVGYQNNCYQVLKR